MLGEEEADQEKGAGETAGAAEAEARAENRGGVKMPSIAICTPWRDHPELEHDYFAAIDAGKPDQLIVVDDCSEEPLAFAALRLDTPGGFCTASNAGLAMVETDHVVFLNNDVRPLRPSWLDEVRAAITPGYLVGPLVANQFCTVDDVEYPYVDGWCLGMTTEDARSLGGWDESYDEAGPGYFSDTVLAFEARLKGMTLRELRPGLAHKGGQTGGSGPNYEHALRVNQQKYIERIRSVVGAPS